MKPQRLHTWSLQVVQVLKLAGPLLPTWSSAWHSGQVATPCGGSFGLAEALGTACCSALLCLGLVAPPVLSRAPGPNPGPVRVPGSVLAPEAGLGPGPELEGLGPASLLASLKTILGGPLLGAGWPWGSASGCTDMRVLAWVSSDAPRPKSLPVRPSCVCSAAPGPEGTVVALLPRASPAGGLGSAVEGLVGRGVWGGTRPTSGAGPGTAVALAVSAWLAPRGGSCSGLPRGSLAGEWAGDGVGECSCCRLLERGAVVMSIPRALCIWQFRQSHSFTWGGSSRVTCAAGLAAAAPMGGSRPRWASGLPWGEPRHGAEQRQSTASPLPGHPASPVPCRGSGGLELHPKGEPMCSVGVPLCRAPQRACS